MLNSAGAWSQFIAASIEILVFLWAGIKMLNKFSARLDKLDQIDDRIKKVESQYVPNGGSSMRDAINRIEKNMDKLQERFDNHIDKQK